MKPLVAVAALAALTLAAPAPGFPQTSPALESPGTHIEERGEDLNINAALRALGKELEAIKEGQQALHKDRQEMKTAASQAGCSPHRAAQGGAEGRWRPLQK